MVSSSTAQLLADAARVVAQVAHHGRALDEALQRRHGQTKTGSAALQAVSFGAVRWYPRLARWIGMLASQPAAAIQPEVHALLAVGIHQLHFSRHPPHAIGNSVVDAVRLLGQPRAAGFVNAILRRFVREQTSLQQSALSEPESRHAHPRWLIDRIRADWPQAWEQILEAGNQPPPMWLRVNRRLGTAGEYRDLLATRGMEAVASEHAPDALLLAQPVDVEGLPDFSAGRVSVQDAGAQLAVEMLDAQPGMRVLDACAAPGGKAAHLLERVPRLQELVVLDRSARRLRQVVESFARLGLHADEAAGGGQGPGQAAAVSMIAADASQPEQWPGGRQKDAQPFQRIVLDVPCSATGVIRRHPDIKLLRRETDIPALAATQLRLLRALWPLLQPDGRLLYVTCSLLHAENGGVVGAFLAEEPTAVEHSLHADLPMGLRPSQGPGVQILPGAAGMDGFYYACLEKH